MTSTDNCKKMATFCSSRWIVAYMGLWLGMLMYLHDSTMSVAIVCMVQQPPKYQETNTSHQDMSPRLTLNASSFSAAGNLNSSNKTINTNTTFEFNKSPNIPISPNTGELTWTKELQSFVLSGYYYGKIVSQIPAGWLSARFGGRNLVGCCITMAIILTVLIPVFARTSVYLVVVTRFLLGICVNMNFPTYFGLAGIWARPTERSRFIAFFLFGLRLGPVVGYLASGFLCVHGFDNGWPSIFYIHGMIEVLFLCCWFALIHSSPEQHPRITIVEKPSTPSTTSTLDTKAKGVPWRHILTYGPIYATYMAHIGDNFCIFLLMTSLPMYMNEVLKFDIESNGLMSSLPFIVLACGTFVSGTASDFIRKKNVISVTRLRKITVCIGFFGIAVCINVPGYVGESNRDLAVLALCMCTLFESVESAAGFCSNMLDIAPGYASVIFGLSNTVANILPAVIPVIVAAITVNNTAEEWRIVFYIAAGVPVFAAFIYLIFGDSEQAKWYQLHLHPQKQQQDEQQKQQQDEQQKHQSQQKSKLEAETKSPRTLEKF